MGHCFRCTRRLSCFYVILYSTFPFSVPSSRFSCLKDTLSNLRILQDLEIIRTRRHYSYFVSPFNLSKNYSEIKRTLPLVLIEPGRVRKCGDTFLPFLSPPFGVVSIPFLQKLSHTLSLHSYLVIRHLRPTFPTLLEHSHGPGLWHL